MTNRKAMIFFILLITSFVAILAIQSVIRRNGDQESPSTILRVGEAPQELEVTSMGGDTFNLSGLKGKVVLINFWATWCPPCIDEIPSLNQTYLDLNKDGFEILSFSIDANGRKILPDFIRKHEINYPIILDADQRYARHFSVLGVPENIIIAKDGTIAEKRYGSEDWTSPEVRKMLLDLLQN